MYHAQRQEAGMTAQRMKVPPGPPPQPYPFPPQLQHQQPPPQQPRPPVTIDLGSSTRKPAKASGSKSKSRRKRYHDDTDSDISYDSDDDRSSFSSDTTDRKGHRRKSARHSRSRIYVSRRSPSPSRRKEYYIDPSARPASYMPPVPRQETDPVAAAYSAGRMAADEERLRREMSRRPAPGGPQVGRVASYVPPPPAPRYVPDRYVPEAPRPILSHSAPNISVEDERRYANEQIMQRTNARLDERRFAADYEREARELEERQQTRNEREAYLDADLRRAQRSAEQDEEIRRKTRGITVPNEQRYLDDRYQVDRLGRENRLKAIHNELEYPKDHDNRRYHPQDGWAEDETMDPNILNKLLVKWTHPKAETGDDWQKALGSGPQDLDVSSDKGYQRSEEAGEPSAVATSANNTGFVWYGRSEEAEEPAIVGVTRDADVVSGGSDQRPEEDEGPSTDAAGAIDRNVLSEKGDKIPQENYGVQEEARGRTPGRTYTVSNPSRQPTVDDADPSDEEQMKAEQGANKMTFLENQGGPSSQPAPTSAEKGKGKASIRQSSDPQPRRQHSQPSWADPAWAQRIVDTTVADDSPADRPGMKRTRSYGRRFSEDPRMGRREHPRDRFEFNGRSVDDYVARTPFLMPNERILSESPQRFADPAAISSRAYPERAYSESPQRPVYETAPRRVIYSNESFRPQEPAIPRVNYSDLGRPVDPAPSRPYIEPRQRGMDPIMPSRTYPERFERTYTELPPRFANPTVPRVIYSDSVPPSVAPEFPSTSYPEGRYDRIYSEQQLAHPIDPYSDNNLWADDPGLRRTGSHERMRWEEPITRGQLDSRSHYVPAPRHPEDYI
jgi:hypothetical protein